MPFPAATTSGTFPLRVQITFFLFSFFGHFLFLLFEFRFAKYFQTENGTEFRTLHKAFAIRFDVMVTGKVSCVTLACVRGRG